MEAKITSVETRLTTLESKEDNDKQTLSIDGKVVSISNGNSITLPEEEENLFKRAFVQAFSGYMGDNDEEFLSFAIEKLSEISKNGNGITELKSEVQELEEKNESLEARVAYLEEQSRHDNDHL